MEGKNVDPVTGGDDEAETESGVALAPNNAENQLVLSKFPMEATIRFSL